MVSCVAVYAVSNWRARGVRVKITLRPYQHKGRTESEMEHAEGDKIASSGWSRRFTRRGCHELPFIKQMLRLSLLLTCIYSSQEENIFPWHGALVAIGKGCCRRTTQRYASTKTGKGMSNRGDTDSLVYSLNAAVEIELLTRHACVQLPLTKHHFLFPRE